MQTNNWRPSASIKALRQRALVLQEIRQFFAVRDVLEVDTPALSHATVTDEHLHSFCTQFTHPFSPQASTLYLQTSPEFAMKRLLCAGSGAIYQICKSFRNEEAGRFHNPEFTMLEWYRPGFDHLQLMTEIDELIQMVVGCDSAERVTYQDVFKQYLGYCPLTATLTDIKTLASQYGYAELAANENDKDTLLMLLFSQHVEPHIGQDRPCFVMDFPASQAALARLSPTNSLVAERFELYFQGIELANGFHELTDGPEQLRRFEQDNVKRQHIGLEIMPIDHNFIAAIDYGLPACAGVALGIDRLLMLALNYSEIDKVIAFENSRA
ncbi:elongation factor P--(R)-beta-lysine ligase [Paraglaciecola psychrophila]|jgi:lysyl-tRNA synthetase class 2|uniref:Lysyl-tRNA synthetase-like protein GenX n=1 Tax=Paraglaciecola psychrophila 170 TaxID=1129794 RepID=K6ZJ69_9ALTE|nr:elongation factor P--(R)-beta-lysine ligase [Paraglaciecola psychrophila]AGH42588.1 lysyl-tRNA synthetase-like protein GenX [Paraglaciecola psychrophila 170]GAC36046.1 lysyl-tRNA synthetase-related protein [Paraglaciecola psychrophila 170]